MKLRGSEEERSWWIQVLLHSCLRDTWAGKIGENSVAVNATLSNELCQTSISFCRILLENDEMRAKLNNRDVSPHFCIWKQNKTKQVLHLKLCKFLCPCKFRSRTGFLGNTMMYTQQELLFLRGKEKWFRII